MAANLLFDVIHKSVKRTSPIALFVKNCRTNYNAFHAVKAMDGYSFGSPLEGTSIMSAVKGEGLY